MVRRYWNDSPIRGWMGFRLKEKLKRLKTSLKHWNKVTYGEVDLNIQVLVESIKALDLKGEDIGLSQEESNKRKVIFTQLRHLLKSKDRLAFERSRSRWLKEGGCKYCLFPSLY